ncbi:MAG TPA: hypothetical protein VN193_13580 [Candidatus Angelobacter sp.]|nr:hypothetical protein [Candidatus Angelobacter sp.]
MMTLRSLARTALAVPVVLVAVLAAGCGSPASPGVASIGGSGSASPTPSHSVDVVAIITHFAQCARQHGAAGVPDPALDAAGQPDFQPLKQAMSGMPQNVQQAVAGACSSILAALPPPPPPDAAAMHALTQYAACMRGHGVANFPDPDPQTGRFVVPPGMDGKANPYLQAATTCGGALPHGVTPRFNAQGG